MSHSDPDDLPDSDGEVEVIDRNKTKQSYVIIISYEAAFVPFELTMADALTQFFTDYNNIRTGVRNYIIDDESIPRELVGVPNYVKEVCDVRTVSRAIEDNRDCYTEHEYGPAPVTFILCHGGPRPTDGSGGKPACLLFGEDRHTSYGENRRVWARYPENDDYLVSYWGDQVYLEDLIKTSKMAILMCCHGDQIVQDYVAEQTEEMRVHEIPDILFYNCGEVHKTTHMILMALLMNLIDSDNRLLKDPTPDELHEVVQTCTMTILKIVKWCSDDINKFWTFLLDTSCIISYEIEKERQGLPIPVKRVPNWKLHYRVSGHMYHDYISQDQEENIFNEFKTLTLISRGESQPVTHNYQSVDPFPSDSSQRLWVVLQDYVMSARQSADKASESVKQHQSFDFNVARACIKNRYLVL